MEALMSETMQQKQQREVDNNYAYFKTLPPEEIQEHMGQYALLKNKSVAAYFSTYRDALYAGRLLAKDDRLFSIQKVGESVQHLDWFSSI